MAFGCSILVILLAAAAWAAYVRWGSPWIDRKREEITERHPRVAAALNLAKDRNASFSGVTIAPDDPGSTDPADFPDDVFIPRRAVHSAFRTGPDRAQAVFEIDATPQEIAEMYRAEMPETGWERHPVPDPADGIALEFFKGNSKVRIGIHEGRARTEVWISRTPGLAE